ncbi:MAG: NAD(P)/FAD-dependent oxidoreductase [Burkholderiales bacterium]|jgi:cation diffusion facilitator CzcD-associated flavoprotein CzcO|nr:NAD(P)/FAD-dependent oxidoreductase [Burkholderiales bacterium]
MKAGTTPARRLGQALDVAVIGAGFGGLGMAIHLRRAGLRYIVLEHAQSLGGTWRDNRYPGAACDVPSNLYCYSFEPNPDWSRVYPDQAEIEAYMNRCADKYGVRDAMRFGTRVIGLRYEPQAALWRISLEDDTEMTARFVVSATGGLSRPKLPEIEGLGTFRGALFHSARWNHDFSLAGKTVAVIGTGASAIQIVPAIAPKVGRLLVFQRTPAWIVPRDDRPRTEAERARYRKHPWTQRLSRLATYVRFESRAVGFTKAPGLLRFAEKHVRRYIAHEVPDRTLRLKFTPTYALGCKRVLMSNDFYRTFRRENVALMCEPIVRATPAGLVTADGVEHAADAIVAATGFHAAEAGSPFPVLGVGGRELNEGWREGAQAYLGTTVAGFPNFFMITGPNTGLGHNSMIYIIESQIAYIMNAIATLTARKLAAVDVRPDIQATYNAEIQARLAHTVWNTGGCRSWYLTRDGRNTTLWPGFTFEYRRRTKRFHLGDYSIVAPASGAAP